MEVIATKRGYHGKLREPGDKFDVPDGVKASWFEPTKPPVVEKPAAAKAAKKADAEQPPVVEKPADDLV